jgi:hypothetical protein
MGAGSSTSQVGSSNGLTDGSWAAGGKLSMPILECLQHNQSCHFQFAVLARFFILYGPSHAEFVTVMSRDIREFDNEQDLRTAWKVFDKVRLIWASFTSELLSLSASGHCSISAGEQGIHQHIRATACAFQHWREAFTRGGTGVQMPLSACSCQQGHLWHRISQVGNSESHGCPILAICCSPAVGGSYKRG